MKSGPEGDYFHAKLKVEEENITVAFAGIGDTDEGSNSVLINQV